MTRAGRGDRSKKSGRTSTCRTWRTPVPFRRVRVSAAHLERPTSQTPPRGGRDGVLPLAPPADPAGGGGTSHGTGWPTRSSSPVPPVRSRGRRAPRPPRRTRPVRHRPLAPLARVRRGFGRAAGLPSDRNRLRLWWGRLLPFRRPRRAAQLGKHAASVTYALVTGGATGLVPAEVGRTSSRTAPRRQGCWTDPLPRRCVPRRVRPEDVAALVAFLVEPPPPSSRGSPSTSTAAGCWTETTNKQGDKPK